jgi:signal transduction histidine kinase
VALTMELERRREEVQATTEQLWQAGKLASVGELAASVAHELNNPLTAITLWTEKMLAEIPARDPCRPGIEVIDQEAARMARLVRNLLQFCRRGGEHRSTVSLADEVEGTLDLVQHLLGRQRVTVVREVDGATPPIQADRQQLRQVFLNVVTNAVDAMPQGGTLRIAASADDGRPEAVALAVSDTGGGIPETVLPSVCDPFFTTRPEGTGLGLAIAKRYVEQNGGRLDVTSRLGEGTTVTLHLPTAAVADARAGVVPP